MATHLTKLPPIYGPTPIERLNFACAWMILESSISIKRTTTILSLPLKNITPSLPTGQGHTVVGCKLTGIIEMALQIFLCPTTFQTLWKDWIMKTQTHHNLLHTVGIDQHMDSLNNLLQWKIQPPQYPHQIKHISRASPKLFYIMGEPSILQFFSRQWHHKCTCKTHTTNSK